MYINQNIIFMVTLHQHISCWRFARCIAEFSHDLSCDNAVFYPAAHPLGTRYTVYILVLHRRTGRECKVWAQKIRYGLDGIVDTFMVSLV